jgi:hypothetical protein
MNKATVLFFATMAFTVIATVALAQGPGKLGVGGDIHPVKAVKVKVVKRKVIPLYTEPKSLPWYRGGGPAPVGNGTK